MSRIWLAVLATWGPAAAQGTPDPLAIEAAVKGGLEYLVASQELDGTWSYDDAQYPLGQTALGLYTLVECGVPHGHPAVQRAAIRLEEALPEKTYELACLVLALEALGADENAERIEALVKRLLDWQQGGFAYPDGPVDLSNTQYATLALRAGVRAGARVPYRAWQGIAEAVMQLQLLDGGFGYRDPALPSGALTAAGVAVLGIAREELERAGALYRPLRTPLDKALEKGTEWLTANFSVEFNPKPDNAGGADRDWTYYYLHGIERVSAVHGTDALGGRDWYAEGARWLLESQSEDGSWTSALGGPAPNTCFALLFLQRATHARSDRPARARRRYGEDSPVNDVSLLAVGDSPLSLWISSFGDRARARYGWPGEEERGLRVVRVEYVSGDRVLATVEGDATQPAEDERFETQVTFPEPDDLAVHARVYVRPPGTDEAATALLESPRLDVVVKDVLTDWMIEYARAPLENLLRDTRVDVRASSRLDDGHAPEYAVDGLQTRGWVCAEGDESPTLSLELARSKRANVVLLSKARRSPLEGRVFAQPDVVELKVSGHPLVTVELEPDEQRKTEVVLTRTVAVRKMELRIVSRTPGRQYLSATGFMEVELVNRRDSARR